MPKLTCLDRLVQAITELAEVDIKLAQLEAHELTEAVAYSMQDDCHSYNMMEFNAT